MKHLFAILAGLTLGFVVWRLTGLGWWFVGMFFSCALICQVLYAHRLNKFLGGADPVQTIGVRNLSQLRKVVKIPMSTVFLAFVALMFFWGAIEALVLALGWLKTT